MGYNTVVLILNDAKDDIRNNAAEFAEQVTLNYGAYVDQEQHSDRWPDGIGTTPSRQISIGSHCNGAAVVTCNHSSETSLILVGGNYATVLGTANGGEHHNRNSVKRILNDILSEYNLKVVEKREDSLPKAWRE